MKPSMNKLPVENIDSVIRVIRGQKVIIDADLAQIYGVETKRLNEAVRRNSERFPEDFLFRLAATEADEWRLRSQFATLKRGQHRKYLPYAFTEHGAMMAANVLRSKRAIAMSIFVVRAFNKMRELLANNKALSEKLNDLEKTLTGRLDQHQNAILHILEELKKLAAEPDTPPRREIGFHTKNTLKNPPAQSAQ